VTFFYKAVETPGDPLKLMSHKTLAVVLENVDLKRVRLGELLEAVDHPILERAEDQLSHFSAGGPRRRCGKRQEVASKAACSAVQSYIAPLRQCVVSIKSRCSKLLETACDPFQTERHLYA
jgi:hypothetical protein